MNATERNVEARNAHTQALLHKKRPADGQICLSAAEAEEALFGIAYKQPGDITLDDCKDILTRILDERGHMEVDAVLSRHGVWKITDMFTGMYKRFYLYCQSILTYGASPYYGWEIGSIKGNCRDRFLLWHAESDCLWEVRGKLAGELDSGEVEDVTGQLQYEERFLAENRRYGDPLPPKEEEL